MKWVNILLLLLIFLWASSGLTKDLARVLRGIPHAVDYVLGMWPPDILLLPQLVKPLVETIRIAIVGTVLAALISIPLSFLAARDTAPNAMIYFGSRGLINFLRAIPTLLWALLFVSLVGLGPLAGVFAITCHCIGTLGKLFSESIEGIGPNVVEQMEAMRVDGANEYQTIYHGLLPAVSSLFASYILYYFESNVRAATVLGLVGAGGIGLHLTHTIRLFKRHETLTVLLVILLTVVIIDTISRQIRRRLIED